MGAMHVHELMSLNGVIDAPTWTFDHACRAASSSYRKSSLASSPARSTSACSAGSNGCPR